MTVSLSAAHSLARVLYSIGPIEDASLLEQAVCVLSSEYDHELKEHALHTLRLEEKVTAALTMSAKISEQSVQMAAVGDRMAHRLILDAESNASELYDWWKARGTHDACTVCNPVEPAAPAPSRTPRVDFWNSFRSDAPPDTPANPPGMIRTEAMHLAKMPKDLKHALAVIEQFLDLPGSDGPTPFVPALRILVAYVHLREKSAEDEKKTTSVRDLLDPAFSPDLKMLPGDPPGQGKR